MFPFELLYGYDLTFLLWYTAVGAKHFFKATLKKTKDRSSRRWVRKLSSDVCKAEVAASPRDWGCACQSKVLCDVQKGETSGSINLTSCHSAWHERCSLMQQLWWWESPRRASCEAAEVVNPGLLLSTGSVPVSQMGNTQNSSMHGRMKTVTNACMACAGHEVLK